VASFFDSEAFAVILKKNQFLGEGEHPILRNALVKFWIENSENRMKKSQWSRKKEKSRKKEVVFHRKNTRKTEKSISGRGEERKKAS